MLEFRDGTKTNSQARVQDESTYTTKERGWLVQVECKWCDGLNRDNLRHKLYTSLQPLGGGTTPLPIIYYVIFCEGYIQMTFFLETLLSQNFGWSYRPQIKPIWSMWGHYLIALNFFFIKVYFMPALIKDNLTPAPKDSWLGVKFSIWFLPFLLIIIHVY